MAEVHGIGAFKLKKYGERFLAALGEFSGAEEIKGKDKKEEKNIYEKLERLRRSLAKKKICRHHKFFPIQSSVGSQKPARQPKKNSAV